MVHLWQIFWWHSQVSIFIGPGMALPFPHYSQWGWAGVKQDIRNACKLCLDLYSLLHMKKPRLALHLSFCNLYPHPATQLHVSSCLWSIHTKRLLFVCISLFSPKSTAWLYNATSVDWQSLQVVIDFSCYSSFPQKIECCLQMSASCLIAPSAIANSWRITQLCYIP